MWRVGSRSKLRHRLIGVVEFTSTVNNVSSIVQVKDPGLEIYSIKNKNL